MTQHGVGGQNCHTIPPNIHFETISICIILMMQYRINTVTYKNADSCLLFAKKISNVPARIYFHFGIVRWMPMPMHVLVGFMKRRRHLQKKHSFVAHNFKKCGLFAKWSMESFWFRVCHHPSQTILYSFAPCFC